jgi:hypothetical protein
VFGQLRDLGCERGGDNVGSVGFGEPDEHHEPAVPLDQRRDHAGALAVEQVAFRVARHRSVGGLGDHGRDVALAGVRCLASGAPDTALHPHVASQLFAQRTPGLHEQRQVDRLVRHPHLRVVGELQDQPTRDLLRRPAQLELGFDGLPQTRTPGELGDLRSAHVADRRPIRSTRPIDRAAAVAGHLSRHRRWRSGEPASDDTQRLTRHQTTRDLLPLSCRQPQRRPDRLPCRRSHQPLHRPVDRVPRSRHLLNEPPERRTLRDQFRNPFPLPSRQPLHRASSIRRTRSRRMLLSPPEASPRFVRHASWPGPQPHVRHRGVGEERPTPKDSPNFSLTLTPPLTWAGGPRTGARLSQTGAGAAVLLGRDPRFLCSLGANGVCSHRGS